MQQLIEWIVALVTLFSSGKSLNEIFITFTINFLMDPGTPGITTQKYFDQLLIFVLFGLVGFIGEIIYRLVVGRKHEEMSVQVKQLAISGVFLFSFVGSMPFVVLGWQAGYNQLARTIAIGMTGTGTPQELIDRLSTLTGNPAVDVVLTGFQLGFLFIFGIGNNLIPICISVGLCFLVLGVSWRWAPRFGEPLLNFSLSVTLYGTFGAGTSLLLVGIFSWATETNFRDNQFSYGLANTCIFGLAAFGTITLLLRFKNDINAVVTGLVKTISGTRQAVSTGYRKLIGAGDRQVQEAMTARETRSKGSQSHGLSKLQTITSQATGGINREAAAPGAGLKTTAARSLFKVNDLAVVAAKTGAAVATRNPRAGLVAGQAAAQYFKRLPSSPNHNPKVPPTPEYKPLVPGLPAGKPRIPVQPTRTSRYAALTAASSRVPKPPANPPAVTSRMPSSS